MKYNLLSSNQSGFKTGDSCINQLLSITRETPCFFNDDFEVQGGFLDTSKAFDKVWHDGLICTLRCNGVSGKFLDTLTYFLSSRKQRVVLNDQCSSWRNVETGVSQGSILGHMLFLVCTNEKSNYSLTILPFSLLFMIQLNQLKP